MINPSNWNVHRTNNILFDIEIYNNILDSKLQNMTGVCAADELNYYVIQGQIYTPTSDLYNFLDADSYYLDPACQAGDYYLATDNENFYIIYGAHVHHTSNMSKNTDASDFALHPKLVEFLPFTDFSGDWVKLTHNPSESIPTIRFGVNQTLSESFTTIG